MKKKAEREKKNEKNMMPGYTLLYVNNKYKPALCIKKRRTSEKSRW